MVLGLGSLLGPTPGAGPTSTPAGPEDMQARAAQFEEFFRRPEVVSGLLQFGVQAMQPVGPGQSALGHLGQSVAAGAGAAGRVKQQERDAEAAARTEAREQQRVDIAQQQADTAQEQSRRSAAVADQQNARGNRAQSLQERQADINNQFKRDRLAFDQSTAAHAQDMAETSRNLERMRLQLSQESNAIARARLEQDMALEQQKMQAEGERLSDRLAVQLQVAGDRDKAGIISSIARAEVQNAVISGQPVDINKIVATVEAAFAAQGQLNADPAAQGVTPPTAEGSPAPAAAPPAAAVPAQGAGGDEVSAGIAAMRQYDPNQLTPANKQLLFANPQNEAIARQAWGDEVVDRMKAEIVGR